MLEVTHHDLWREPQRRRLVRLCAAITRDRDAAEDLAQETLLEAWRSRHKLHDPAGADRWLAAIARNVCLRWARRRPREVPLREEAVELLRDDVGDLLALVPPATRAVLEYRYVHDLPHAEIAARLGMSTDAVSMRLSRGKAELRRHLGADGGWQETRIWCFECGRRKLELRREQGAVSFRCTSCGDGPASVFDPAMFGNVSRPSAILNRAGDWATTYFADGAGEVECIRCESRVLLAREEGYGAFGLHGVCKSCGYGIWTSLHGLAHSRPEVRAFRRAHPRARVTRGWQVDHADVVRVESLVGSAHVDVLFARDTLRFLAAH